jgi:hypothetical protein
MSIIDALRLSLATALGNDPVVVFLTETTTVLGPQARCSLHAQSRELRARATAIQGYCNYAYDKRSGRGQIGSRSWGGGRIVATDTLTEPSPVLMSC